MYIYLYIDVAMTILALVELLKIALIIKQLIFIKVKANLI